MLSGARSGRRRLAAFAALTLSVSLLTACGDDSGPPTLTWYINPDNGGQGRLAEQCAASSNGAYQVDVQVLPNDASQQREQLVRRLAAQDSSIDLMSLDPPFVAEFANAGFLRPFDPGDVATFTTGVLKGPLTTAYWKDQLVAAPFWANTQLLWYRKSVVQAAGVDPGAAGFTWDAMIKAAEGQNKVVGVQANRYEGYMVWINALVVSAGGEIVGNVEAGKDATPEIASPAGDEAARIVGGLARSPAAPPAMPNAIEEDARSSFQGSRGAFMVNWPYVYNAAKEDVASGGISQSVVDDIGWARYPRVTADRPSRPPLGGINLAVGNFTKHPDQAVALVKCVTSLPNNIAYMLDAGNPAARGAAYDDPKVREAFPMADIIRTSINDAGPRPITPYYNDVSTSVQLTWHPPGEVEAPATPKETATFMSDVLQGKRLL
ncbi:multiple sugar transport system substrate-binding protein [Actinoplanes octamycinicus]|uniref:Multiple sugar transport system substrate-binding protein n=1 Tax=Actinoplanes octamycinicus TaxID=135948 RepID=A0A7W7H1R1_9ACTN|nr:extracellular solute-binding protein [Actinoplanes octamycinicus]MBB4742376.1 multiple sugar transport system substrate-binding protein [Actinoplanes octamycinicus]GIE62375.1 ABC transporter substrate-binding protein [Actinoplanes octamycinicus]